MSYAVHGAHRCWNDSDLISRLRLKCTPFAARSPTIFSCVACCTARLFGQILNWITVVINEQIAELSRVGSCDNLKGAVVLIIRFTVDVRDGDEATWFQAGWMIRGDGHHIVAWSF